MDFTLGGASGLTSPEEADEEARPGVASETRCDIATVSRAPSILVLGSFRVESSLKLSTRFLVGDGLELSGFIETDWGLIGW